MENDLSQSNLEDLETLKESLVQLRKIKMQGILIRTHAKIIEDDEKPSKYFCNLEKNTYSSKIIPKIEKEDGTFIKDQVTILEETKLFYQTLYSSRDSELLDFNLETELSGYTVPKLNIDESSNIEGLLAYQQATISLKNMAKNRSPGTDGFNADFFKVFWGQIGQFVVRSINYGFLHNELSVTQKQGIITCIPKENKSRYQIKNYRPISLLNTIYKIASEAIGSLFITVLFKLSK